MSPTSVNRELACRKTICNTAMQWSIASHNPVKGVKLFPEPRRLRFLMRDEIDLLLEACPDYLRPMVIAALNTGMRRGELMNLKWDDVDSGRCQILVRDSKSGERRTIERYAHHFQPHKKKAVETLAGLADGHFLDTKTQKVANSHFGDGR